MIYDQTICETFSKQGCPSTSIDMCQYFLQQMCKICDEQRLFSNMGQKRGNWDYWYDKSLG